MDVQSGPPVPSNPLGKEGWLLAIRTAADVLRAAIQAFATPTSATCPDVALELQGVACGFNPCGDRWIRDQGMRPADPTMRGVVHRPGRGGEPLTPTRRALRVNRHGAG